MSNRKQPLLTSRRKALFAGVTGALSLTALPSIVRAVTATPTETQGPYWVDEKLNRSDVRTDVSTGVAQAGLPLYLTVSLSNLINGNPVPYAGAYIDIWHCNASGAYSDEAAGMGNPNTQGLNWLRGYQITDAHGIANFITIYPGWYSGRTEHIHVRVRTFTGTTNTYNFTTQFFFNETITNRVNAQIAPYNARNNRDTTNATDSVYTGGNGPTAGTAAATNGDLLLLRLSQNNTKATGSFNLRLSGLP
jgi:protocatechuate 3,4-dioxygenase beta subunit